jgi:hypothetical protein
MDDAKQDALKALRGPLDEIAGYEASVLSEGKDLGSMNFREGEQLFQQIIDLANKARALPLALLPLPIILQLHSSTKKNAAVLKQIAEFTLAGQENPENQRNALLENAGTQYDQFLTAFMPYIPYLTLQSAQVQDLITESKKLVEDVRAEAKEFVTFMEERRTETESIVKSAQDAAAKIGVAHFATKFKEIAASHASASKIWLGVSAGLGLGTAGVALAFLEWLPISGGFGEAATLQQIVTKLVVISVMYFAAIWSSKNYRSHRHLFVVNTHRQNALMTFETFVKAAGDEDKETKNAVLLEATRCIFTPSVCGYLGGDQETPSSSIIEVLTKTIGGVGGK